MRRIIDALSPPEPHAVPGSPDIDDDEDTSIRGSYISPPSTSQGSPALLASPPYADLKARLAPLLALEAPLIQQLAGGDDEEATRLSSPPASAPAPAAAVPNAKNVPEISIHNRHNWKKALNKLAGGSKGGACPAWPGDRSH